MIGRVMLVLVSIITVIIRAVSRVVCRVVTIIVMTRFLMIPAIRCWLEVIVLVTMAMMRCHKTIFLWLFRRLGMMTLLM